MNLMDELLVDIRDILSKYVSNPEQQITITYFQTLKFEVDVYVKIEERKDRALVIGKLGHNRIALQTILNAIISFKFSKNNIEEKAPRIKLKIIGETS